MQVLSVWQSAMVIVSTFPHPPETLTNLVDALAKEAGEPDAASFQAAVQNQSALDFTIDTWSSLENHIYKAKMIALPVFSSTAVAV